MNEFSVRDADVVVIGAGRSGIAAAELMARRGGRVVLTDVRSVVEAAEPLQRLGVRLELGGHRGETIDEADLVVLSPGVSPRLPIVERARQREVPVISEVELASRWLQGRVVAVTGTKGKSTTTVLISRMLEAEGRPVLAGGNVGTALSSQVEQSTPDLVHVVETSSFQLELTKTFRPWISVFLNLSADHLDRHATFDEYAAAKARIFENQTADDVMVINADDPQVLALARRGAARRVPFAVEGPIDEGVVISGGHVSQRSGADERRLFPVASVRVKGAHLLSDVLAATAVGTVVDVSPDGMRHAVEAFSGLAHAHQLVAEVGGVRFVNDSKATNVAATRAAIDCVDHAVVIMGGQFKGGDLGDLVPGLAAHADAVVAIGEARPQLVAAFRDAVPVHEAETMEDAVRTAHGLARRGGTVLLAPACASFDMFTDYADRGRAFELAVRGVVEESDVR